VKNIAVAMIQFEGKTGLVWNERWKCFSLPMTKINPGPPAEKPEQAAIRAGSEALGTPCRVVAGSNSISTRYQQRSQSNDVINDYHFQVVQIEPHPDFIPATIPGNRVLMVSTDQLHLEAYKPISPTVLTILQAYITRGSP
jgi:hypothetical protein